MADQDMQPFVSMKTKTSAIDNTALTRAVSAMLCMPVKAIHYQTTPLQGGTLGDVQLVAGEAETADGQTKPFRIIRKTQRQWERPGDPASWRREYDLCQTDFHALFTGAFRWPRCYDTQETQDTNTIWMEVVKGRSGADLTLSDLALAAAELGRFQGRCSKQENALRKIGCLSDAEYTQREFAQWTPDTAEYMALRSDTCALPPHLRQLLIDIHSRSGALYRAIHNLPQVLCHRDYWTENIFVSDGQVAVIDWDCAGWGSIGEDIASLIADETPVEQISDYYHTLLPAYYSGLKETMELPPMHAIPIREMILLKFGYRLLQQFMYARTPEAKAEATAILEQVAALSETRI